MSKKFDFATAEDRLKAWESLQKTKIQNERTIKIAKIKNLIVALVFAFNNLLFIEYLCDLLMKTKGIAADLLTKIPLVNGFIDMAGEYTSGDLLKVLLFGFVFTVVMPCVIALVVRIILSIIIKKDKSAIEALPEGGGQIDAILKADDEINSRAKSYSSPLGVSLGSVFINIIAGVVCAVMMINQSEASLSVLGWISFAGIVILALIVVFIFGFMASLSFSYPDTTSIRSAYDEWNKTAESERLKEERLEIEKQKEEQERAEKEKFDAMTPEELYNYACEIEDNHEQLKLLRMAEKRGYKDACYMITVVERMIEEEQYAKSKACMDAGWAAQDRGDYRLARSKFLDAARLDNPDGMYNYARLSLKYGDRNEAIRWLEKAIASGTYDDADSRMLLAAMKRGEHINVTD